jgi:serine O-acetyltransferase
MVFDDFRTDLVRARQDSAMGLDWFSQNIRILLKPTTLIVAAYRFGHWARQVRLPVIGRVLIVTGAVVRRLLEWLTGCFIMPDAVIGPGFVVHSLYGILIGSTRIGRNFTVHSGAKVADAVMSIGDDVTICMNGMVLERVTIGDNVRVAPGSVVITDVPDNTTVIGVPARIRLRRPPLRPAERKGTAKVDVSILDPHRFVRWAPIPVRHPNIGLN